MTGHWEMMGIKTKNLLSHLQSMVFHQSLSQNWKTAAEKGLSETRVGESMTDVTDKNEFVETKETGPMDKAGWIVRRISELGGYENVGDSVKADVFGFDITDVSGSIKLFSDVMKRLGIKLDGNMQLLVGPPELRYIQNVAIMMFCEHPEKFFGYTYVQMTSFPKGSVENPSISEDFPNITGSVPQMIQATMERFRNLIIREKVIKVPNQMEALRIFNYPYQAIEETV